MISSIITPFRWYDKFYQQNRYDVECKSVCEFKLVTDQKHLLPFQFRRANSPDTITQWLLRKCCNPPEAILLDDMEQKFRKNWSNPDGAWEPDECGGMKAVTNVGWANAKICYELSENTTYTIKFNIAKFQNGLQAPGLFGLNFYVTGSLHSTYQDTGYQSITFTTPPFVGITTICFEFVNNISSSAVTLDFVQITQAFALAGDDVALDTSLLSLKQYSGFDLITYCGNAFATNITPGCYYSIIQDAGGNLYFSEVITVDDFIPEKSPHFKLEWYNSCDLTDIVYTSSAGCTFKNILYLPDAVLTRPEYPFKEEGEEDGNQSFKATFQKWEKIVSLIGYKLPEYIVDALTGMKLHDTIKYYYPARQKQLVLDSAVEIKSLEYEVQYVVNDCFANVELKMLLNDKYVDETCCHNLLPIGKEADIIIIELNVEDPDNTPWALKAPEDPAPTDYYVQKYTEGVGFETVGQYTDGVWISELDDDGNEIIPVGSIIIDQSKGALIDSGAWEIRVGGVYFSPTILSAVYTTGSKWLFIGTLLQNTYGQMQHDLLGFWSNVDPSFSSAEIEQGVEVNFPINTIPTPVFNVRMRSFDINGNVYGFSDPMEIASEP